MSKRGLFVFPAAASFVNLGLARGASMHCRGLLKGRRRFCSPVRVWRPSSMASRRWRRGDGVPRRTPRRTGLLEIHNFFQDLARREIVG